MSLSAISSQLVAARAMAKEKAATWPFLVWLGLGLGVKGRAGVSEIELDGHVQCTLGFKENNFQTQRAAPT